jgi:hypothetical protein
MAYISAAEFSNRHPLVGTISATSFPTTTQFTEWLAWAAGLVNTHLHASTDVTDEGVTIKNVVDQLLWAKYLFELASKRVNTDAVIGQLPSLPVAISGTPFAAQLDSIYANRATRRVAYNFNIDSGRRVW